MCIRARWIGANPEKSDLVNFRVQTEKNLVNFCVLLFFLGKTNKMLPNPPLGDAPEQFKSRYV